MTVSTRPSSALPPRASTAVEVLKLVNGLSRVLKRGSGTVAGGRVGLAIEPSLLRELAAGKPVALVTGTNGKTTTTRMLVAALSDPGTVAGGGVASNITGANMPAGHVAALADSPDAVAAVLEVDEGYLGRLIEETDPRVVVLLNLSRDQLDRISEVRMLVDRWRTAFENLPPRVDGGGPGTVVVANADDPMVVWAAQSAPDVRWVAAGQVWHSDAVGCPSCGGRIVYGIGGTWACERCSFARPHSDAWLEGPALVLADGERHALQLGLPGRFNRANAAMVAVAAPLMGGPGGKGPSTGPFDMDAALARLATVTEVAGRFSSTVRGGVPVRLLLAKNPAGWTAIFDLLDEELDRRTPVVVAINARVADGLDTSWLWDVPFERLGGRPVVATGDRRLDLAVRLRYAEVACTVVNDPLAAVDHAVSLCRPAGTAASGPEDVGPVGPVGPAGPVDFLGNYTAFAELRGRL